MGIVSLTSDKLVIFTEFSFSEFLFSKKPDVLSGFKYVRVIFAFLPISSSEDKLRLSAVCFW